MDLLKQNWPYEVIKYQYMYLPMFESQSMLTQLFSTTFEKILHFVS